MNRSLFKIITRNKDRNDCVSCIPVNFSFNSLRQEWQKTSGLGHILNYSMELNSLGYDFSHAKAVKLISAVLNFNTKHIHLFT